MGLFCLIHLVLFLPSLLGTSLRKARLAEVYLGPVGQENRTGQVPCDAAQQVDDGDAVPAGQLLQVSQDGHLETHRHQAVQDPAGAAEGVRAGLSLPPPRPSLLLHSRGGGAEEAAAGPEGREAVLPLPFLAALDPALPCVEEEGEPEAIHLVWGLGVEEGQKPADIVHAVHLGGGREGRAQHFQRPALAQPRDGGVWGGVPGSRGWPPRGSSRA